MEATWHKAFENLRAHFKNNVTLRSTALSIRIVMHRRGHSAPEWQRSFREYAGEQSRNSVNGRLIGLGWNQRLQTEANPSVAALHCTPGSDLA